MSIEHGFIAGLFFVLLLTFCALFYLLFKRLTTARSLQPEEVSPSNFFAATLEDLQNQLLKRQETIHTLELENQKLILTLQQKEQMWQERQSLMQQTQEGLHMVFENMAQSCLNQTASQIQTSHTQNLSALLSPFQNQLTMLQHQMQEKFSVEEKERHLLAHELRRIQELNHQLSQQASNLTQALLGEQKVQGGWGEMVLERALQACGLREGSEYQLQVSLKHAQTETKVQPDALLFLPNGRHIVIDAKVSLTAYARYVATQNQSGQSGHLTKHLHSLKTHIKLLSKKSYHQAVGLETVDFVILFVPIEAALVLALDHAPDLITYAQNHHVMLVSGSTLLIALRAVHAVWQTEKQSRHCKDIVARAGLLYDKVRLFIESFEAIGSGLDKAQKEYEVGRLRLMHGQGNLLKQVERFREWGVSVHTPLPENDGADLGKSLDPKVCPSERSEQSLSAQSCTFSLS